MDLREYPHICVFGRPGSGKSTLARGISAFDGRPFMDLEDHYHSSHEYAAAGFDVEFSAAQERFMQNEQWVIAGIFPNSAEQLRMLERRFAASDLVLLLDLPARLCLWRVLRRYPKVHGWLKREVFYKYYPKLAAAWFFQRLRGGFPSLCRIIYGRFRRLDLPAILALHEKYPDVKFVRLRSPHEVEEFMNRSTYT